MWKGLVLGGVIAIVVLTALMGWQARGEVATIAGRRATLAQSVDGLKLSLQTRVLELQRQADLPLDLQAAERFVTAVTQPQGDLNTALDRLVNWQACAADPKPCRALRNSLPGSRHELWLIQKKYRALQADLEKIDAELARARGNLVW